MIILRSVKNLKLPARFRFSNRAADRVQLRHAGCKDRVRNTIVTLTVRGALLAGAEVNCSSASALENEPAPSCRRKFRCVRFGCTCAEPTRNVSLSFAFNFACPDRSSTNDLTTPPTSTMIVWPTGYTPLTGKCPVSTIESALAVAKSSVMRKFAVKTGPIATGWGQIHRTRIGIERIRAQCHFDFIRESVAIGVAWAALDAGLNHDGYGCTGSSTVSVSNR